jgi:hypothetical protein
MSTNSNSKERKAQLLGIVGVFSVVVLLASFITSKTKEFQTTVKDTCIISELDVMNKVATCITGTTKVNDDVSVENTIELRLPNDARMLSNGDKIQYEYPTNPTNGEPITDQNGAIKVIEVKDSDKVEKITEGRVLKPEGLPMNHGVAIVLAYENGKWGSQRVNLDLEDITQKDFDNVTRMNQPVLMELTKVKSNSPYSNPQGYIYKVESTEVVTIHDKPDNPFDVPVNNSSRSDVIGEQVFPTQTSTDYGPIWNTTLLLLAGILVIGLCNIKESIYLFKLIFQK